MSHDDYDGEYGVKDNGLGHAFYNQPNVQPTDRPSNRTINRDKTKTKKTTKEANTKEYITM